MVWMAKNQLPFILVFTKTDKVGKKKLRESLEDYKKHLSLSWEEIPSFFVTSSKTSLGREELLEYIEKNNRLFREFKGL